MLKWFYPLCGENYYFWLLLCNLQIGELILMNLFILLPEIKKEICRKISSIFSIKTKYKNQSLIKMTTSIKAELKNHTEKRSLNFE